MPKLTAASQETAVENSAAVSAFEMPGAASREAPGTADQRLVGQRRLRVLHVIDRMGMGGTEVGILKVIRGLGSESFEHGICTIRGYDESFCRSEGFEGQMYVAGRTHPGFQFLLGRLARIMREFRPDVAHSRNWGAIEAMPAARVSGVPVAIHSEHGYEVDMLDGLPKRRRILRRFAYAAADALFTVTEELKNYHARQAWLSSDRIRVLPNGVDTDRFVPRPTEMEATRRRLGLDARSLVLGSIGRLVPIKDHATLLRAAELLISRGIPAQVLLVGSGPELAKHQEFVAGSPSLSGRVVFAGAVSEVAALLNVMDVFVLPSLSEGMSNTLLEAMASSLPVVATRVGGNPELVDSERSGRLFEPGDVAGLATILEQLGRDANLCQELGRAARQRIVRHFSLSAMVESYRTLYVELAKTRGLLVACQV